MRARQSSHVLGEKRSRVPVGTSPAPDTSLRGATHGFGNTEERLIRMNFGVEARDGERRFDSATGTGAVRAHRSG